MFKRLALITLVCCLLSPLAVAAEPKAELLWELVKADNVNELRALCQQRCNFNFHDPASGKTPLLLALQNNHLFLMSLLLSHGADPALPDAWGEPPVIYAVQREDSRLLSRLLAAGAKADSIGRDGNPALITAVRNQQLAHMKQLLAYKAKAGIRDSDGTPALMLALANRSPEQVQILIDAGAPTDVVDQHGRSAEQRAVEYGLVNLLAQTKQRNRSP